MKFPSGYIAGQEFIKKWEEDERIRRRIISNNASLRMKNRANEQKPVPPKTPKPVAWYIYTPDGDYYSVVYAAERATAEQLAKLDIPTCEKWEDGWKVSKK